MRRTFLAMALIAAAIAPMAASAQVSVNVNIPLIQVAPPAPRYEPLPGPRAGQIWIQGNWYWNQRDYVWRPGRWEPARPDYDYAQGRWVHSDGGYRWVEGNWKSKGKGHDDHGSGHCPPGQAKKGRC